MSRPGDPPTCDCPGCNPPLFGSDVARCSVPRLRGVTVGMLLRYTSAGVILREDVMELLTALPIDAASRQHGLVIYVAESGAWDGEEA